VYTAKSKNEKRQQHLFFFWHKRENHNDIREKLESIGREDLIEKLIEEKKKHHKQEFIKSRSRGNKKGGKQRKKGRNGR
ncbi:MAG: YgiQ family radical SAM protein, partial [Phaeodactylibacter sp.]|nr:YgiQ family radical SAM protein [Phaeodactylibacter sp.]